MAIYTEKECRLPFLVTRMTEEAGARRETPEQHCGMSGSRAALRVTVLQRHLSATQEGCSSSCDPGLISATVCPPTLAVCLSHSVCVRASPYLRERGCLRVCCHAWQRDELVHRKLYTCGNGGVSVCAHA